MKNVSFRGVAERKNIIKFIYFLFSSEFNMTHFLVCKCHFRRRKRKSEYFGNNSEEER